MTHDFFSPIPFPPNDRGRVTYVPIVLLVRSKSVQKVVLRLGDERVRDAQFCQRDHITLTVLDLRSECPATGFMPNLISVGEGEEGGEGL